MHIPFASGQQSGVASDAGCPRYHIYECYTRVWSSNSQIICENVDTTTHKKADRWNRANVLRGCTFVYTIMLIYKHTKKCKILHLPKNCILKTQDSLSVYICYQLIRVHVSFEYAYILTLTKYIVYLYIYTIVSCIYTRLFNSIMCLCIHICVRFYNTIVHGWSV